MMLSFNVLNTEAGVKLGAGQQAKVPGMIQEVGRFVHAEAVLRAPISPKQEQVILKKPTKTGKARFTTQKHNPGGLERSITLRFLDGGLAAMVFVPSTSEAGRYAGRMHDERGQSWQNLGPGSLAKPGSSTGAVGEKYVVRAWTENVSAGKIKKIADAHLGD